MEHIYTVTVGIHLESQQSDLQISKALDLTGTEQVLNGVNISDTVQTMLDNVMADLYGMLHGSTGQDQ